MARAKSGSLGEVLPPVPPLLGVAKSSSGGMGFKCPSAACIQVEDVPLAASQVSACDALSDTTQQTLSFHDDGVEVLVGWPQQQQTAGNVYENKHANICILSVPKVCLL